MQYFGIKLKELRTNKGLTQKEVADQIGVVSATVSAYEQGKKYPSLDILIKICTLFGVSSDFLLGLTDNMNLMKSELTDEQVLLIRKLIRELEKGNQ